jgi:6-phosphogluconolactonase
MLAHMRLVYAGTYTDGVSRGIYRLAFEPSRGALSAPVLVAEAVNPSFLAWHPHRPVLYAVSEIHDGEGGGLLAYAVAYGGRLTLLGEQASGGRGACYVSIHPEGTHAFVANYRTGSVAAFPLRADGGVEPVSAFVQHAGAGVHPQRQQGPHAHAIRTAPGGRFVLAADLGADRLFVYRFDRERGELTPHGPPSAPASPGAGPRHIAAHPSGDTVWVVNELDSTIASYAWDGVNGTLELRDVTSTLPTGFRGENTTAEVAVHPGGRVVYVSNRGHDSLAVFQVGDDGSLACAGHCPTGGRTPRHFAIDPDGTWLIVANQESDTLCVFGLDPNTGELAETGSTARVRSPTFVGFQPWPDSA